MWLSLFAYSLALSSVLTYSYLKGRDKRRVIFAIAFYLSSITFLMLFIGLTGPEIKIVFWQNFYYWTSIPLLFAINVAFFEQILKSKDFNKIFYVFLIITLISFIPVILPYNTFSVYSFIRQIIALEVILVSAVLFIKNKQTDNLLFLLSMISFTIGGLGLAHGSEYLGIYSQFMGYIFITLIFVKPKADIQKGFSSYFSLEKKLKQTQETLEKKEQMYQKIVENTSDVIMLNDSNGIITYISPSSEKILGYAPEELVGKRAYTIHPEDHEKVMNIYSQVFQDGNTDSSNAEYRIKTKNGETRWISHSWTPLFKNNKFEMMASSLRNIDEQKKVECEIKEKVDHLNKSELATLNIMEDFQDTINELEIAKKEIIDLNKNLEKKVEERTNEVQKLLQQKDEFIHQLGHDLKTPLTPISTLLPLVKKKISDKKLIEMLDVVIQNAEYMKNLVVKTLQLARLNSPNLKLETEKTNLLEEINRILDNKAYIFKEHELKIENNIDDNLFVNADKLRLEELFDNLISNAVKYNSNREGKITLEAKEDKDDIIISVKDTGVGVTQEQIRHIFDEFYKVDPSRHDLESTGLGLTICKRIVDKHGGKIWVESLGKDKGATFYFTLKRYKDN